MKCVVCGIEKPLDQFNRTKANPGGYRYDCRECSRAKFRAWKLANPGKHQESRLRWRAAHPERVREINRRHAQRHRQKYGLESRARDAVNHALANGLLVRLWCARCMKDDGRIEAHHHSYAERDWLDVTWLCHPCHRWLHTNIAGREE